jgi:hypothetical protein
VDATAPFPHGTILVAGSLHGPGSPLPMPRTSTHIFAPEVSPLITVRVFGLGATPRQVVAVTGSTLTYTS